MIRIVYTISAWCLALATFVWIVTPEHDLNVPTGTTELVELPLQVVLDALCEEFPSGYDVELLAFDDLDSDVWGWTTFEDGGFEIHVWYKARIETIIHEYAHVLVWDAVQSSDHDGIYWGAYGNLYRYLIEE